MDLNLEESIENFNEDGISEFQDFIKQKKLTSEFYPNSPINKTKLIQYSRAEFSQSFFKNLKLAQEYDLPSVIININALKTKSNNKSLLHHFFKSKDIPKEKEKQKYEGSSEDEIDSEEEAELLLNSLVSKVASKEENVEKISETVVKEEFELLKNSDALEEEVKLLLNLLVAKTELEENKEKSDKTVLEDEVEFLHISHQSESAINHKIEQGFHKVSHFLFESPLIPKSEKEFFNMGTDEKIESNKISECSIKFRNIDEKKSLLDVFFETSFSNVSKPHDLKEERVTKFYLRPSRLSSQIETPEKSFEKIINKYNKNQTLEQHPWSTWCNDSYDFPEEIQSYYQMNVSTEKSSPKAVS